MTGPAFTPGIAEVEGRVTSLEWRTDLDHPDPRLAFMADLLVSVEDHDEEGMPSPGEKEALAQVARPFLAAAGDDACWVGARTAHATRKWTVYASSPDWVGGAVAALRAGAPERLIVARTLHDPGWTVHEWHRQLTLRANGDLKLLAAHGGGGALSSSLEGGDEITSPDPVARIDLAGGRLIGVGVSGIGPDDRSASRQVEWRTAYPEEEWAHLAAIRFERLGLRTTVQSGQHGWLVTARVWMEVDLANIIRGSATTRRVCDDLHGHYFGWSAL